MFVTDGFIDIFSFYFHWITEGLPNLTDISVLKKNPCKNNLLVGFDQVSSFFHVTHKMVLLKVHRKKTQQGKKYNFELSEVNSNSYKKEPSKTENTD